VAAAEQSTVPAGSSVEPAGSADRPGGSVDGPAGAAVALVTGAGRGIGRAVACRLSCEGMRVALTSRSREQLAETAAACQGSTLVLPMDISEPDAPDRLVAAVSEEWGPVDVLVANAGIGFSARVDRTSDEDWQRVIDLNLTATFRCLRAVIPSMRQTGAGRIVVIGSIASKVGEPYLSAYSASKHGVLGLVRSAAMELARSGVTVNAVCPGYVDTPMTEATVRGIVSMTGRSADEARQILEAKQPTGRLVAPEEVADAVWMCIVNPSINGQGINVDGGAVQS
jgi:NAD(P)-dependent dehydrogenase (short-subunit alcohol dehydrogenase family)